MALDSMQVQYAAYCVAVQSVRLVDFLPLPIHQSTNRTPTAQHRYVLDLRIQTGKERETTSQDTAISNITHQLDVSKPLLPPESKTSRIHLLKSSFAGQSVNQSRQNFSVSTLSTKSKNASKFSRVNVNVLECTAYNKISLSSNPSASYDILTHGCHQRNCRSRSTVIPLEIVYSRPSVFHAFHAL
jgi:hypothetical protein